MAVNAQCGDGEQSAFKAMSFASAKNALWRPSGISLVVGEVVKKFLDVRGRFERAQDAEILRGKAEVAG